jgi:hypothetical protein
VERIDLYLPVIEGSCPFSDEPARLLDPLIHLLLRPASEFRHVPHEVGRDDLFQEVPRDLPMRILATTKSSPSARISSVS